MMAEGRYQMLPVKEINLDFENPRIKRYIEMYPGDVQLDQILLALGAGAPDEGEGATTFNSLQQSIRTHGGIIHPILVNEQEDGNLVVIEGNTRVAIYLKFLQRGYKGEWNMIPAMVYKNLDKADIDRIRLQSHLVGPRQWDPYSKAKYLHHLRNSEHLTWDQVVDFSGGRKKEAQDYVGAYEDMEEYYRPKLGSDGQFDPTRFSAFVELQNPRIQSAIRNAGFDRYDFAEWVITQLIYPLHTVRKLPQILADEQARKTFLSDGARDAIRLIDAPTPDSSLSSLSLESLASEISSRIRLILFTEVTQLQEERDGPRVLALLEAKEELEVLCRVITEDD